MQKSRPLTTVDRIMAAASAHFAERGFDGARMDTIAKMANVNKATIYYHIGDKKALYSAVLHEVFSKQAAHIAEQTKRAASCQDQLKAIIRGMRRLIEKEPYINAIMMYEIASGGRNFPQQLVHDFTEIIGMTHSALEQGRATKQFASAHPMAVYLMAISPISYYEKIYSDLNKQLASGSQKMVIPIISIKAFAEQLETMVLKALKP